MLQRRFNTETSWGLALLVFCGLATLIILDQPAGHTVRGAPNARFFPLVLVGWLAVLAVILLVGGIRTSWSADGEAQPPDWPLLRQAGLAVAALVAYVYIMANLRGWARAIGLFPPRGSVFALTTALFLSGFFYLLGERRLRVNGLLTLSLTGVLYLSFITILDVRFP